MMRISGSGMDAIVWGSTALYIPALRFCFCIEPLTSSQRGKITSAYNDGRGCMVEKKNLRRYAFNTVTK